MNQMKANEVNFSKSKFVHFVGKTHFEHARFPGLELTAVARGLDVQVLSVLLLVGANLDEGFRKVINGPNSQASTSYN